MQIFGFGGRARPLRRSRASSPEGGAFGGGGKVSGIAIRRPLGGAYPFRLAASRQATFPKGTAFGGGGKVSGIAIRRPLGGAGCERSEQTEGVHPLSSCIYHIFIDNKPYFAVN